MNGIWLLGLLSCDAYQRIRLGDSETLAMTALYFISILLFTPLSETHHLNFILPAVIWMFVNVYPEIRTHRYGNAVGLGLFLVCFYVGKIDKTGPGMFFSLLILSGWIYVWLIRRSFLSTKAAQQT